MAKKYPRKFWAITKITTLFVCRPVVLVPVVLVGGAITPLVIATTHNVSKNVSGMNYSKEYINQNTDPDHIFEGAGYTSLPHGILGMVNNEQFVAGITSDSIASILKNVLESDSARILPGWAHDLAVSAPAMLANVPFSEYTNATIPNPFARDFAVPATNQWKTGDASANSVLAKYRKQYVDLSLTDGSPLIDSKTAEGWTPNAINATEAENTYWDKRIQFVRDVQPVNAKIFQYMAQTLQNDGVLNWSTELLMDQIAQSTAYPFFFQPVDTEYIPPTADPTDPESIQDYREKMSDQASPSRWRTGYTPLTMKQVDRYASMISKNIIFLLDRMANIENPKSPGQPLIKQDQLKIDFFSIWGELNIMVKPDVMTPEQAGIYTARIINYINKHWDEDVNEYYANDLKIVHSMSEFRADGSENGGVKFLEGANAQKLTSKSTQYGTAWWRDYVNLALFETSRPGAENRVAWKGNIDDMTTYAIKAIEYAKLYAYDTVLQVPMDLTEYTGAFTYHAHWDIDPYLYEKMKNLERVYPKIKRIYATDLMSMNTISGRLTGPGDPSNAGALASLMFMYNTLVRGNGNGFNTWAGFGYGAKVYVDESKPEDFLASSAKDVYIPDASGKDYFEKHQVKITATAALEWQLAHGYVHNGKIISEDPDKYGEKILTMMNYGEGVSNVADTAKANVMGINIFNDNLSSRNMTMKLPESAVRVINADDREKLYNVIKPTVDKAGNKLLPNQPEIMVSTLTGAMYTNNALDDSNESETHYSSKYNVDGTKSENGGVQVGITGDELTIRNLPAHSMISLQVLLNGGTYQ